jgi:hypothetical protein
MSTIGDVLGSVRQLIDSIDAVLHTDTAKQAPAIARDLNVQPQLRDGVGKLQSALKLFQSGLEPVRETAVSADALVAIFGIVPPFVEAMGDATKESGDYLASLGFGLEGVTGPAAVLGDAFSGVAARLDLAVDAAEDALAFVDPTQFTAIMRSLKTLTEDLDVLKQDPPDPKDAPDKGANGTRPTRAATQ